MWHRYSDPLRQAVRTAHSYAEARGERDLSTRHLLWGIWNAGGHGSEILRRLGVDDSKFQSAIDVVGQCEKPLNAPEPTLTQEARAIVDATYVLARDLGEGYVGDEHFLLSMLDDKNGNDGARLLQNLGIGWEAAWRELIKLQEDRVNAPDGIEPSTMSARRRKAAVVKAVDTGKKMAWAAANYRKEPFLPYLMFRKRTLDNPYPFYAGLRKKPIYWDGLINQWVVSGYKEVAAVLQDQRFSHQQFTLSTWGMEDLPPRLNREFRSLNSRLGTQMLFLDGPRQARLRSLVSKQFTPRVIARMEEQIQHVTDELLEDPAKAGRIELISDLAFPLPATVIARMLGVSDTDSSALKKWSDDFATYIGGETSMVEDYAAYKSMRDLTIYFQAAIDERRESPKDDVITLLISAEDNGDRLTDDEIIANCLLMLAAGHETTTQLIGNGLLALLRHPDQLTLLRANLGLLPSAVEELLRFDSPVQWTSRVTREAFDWNGHSFAKGQLVNVCLAGANHDPGQFTRPDDLDITRDEGRHLAFGYGPHFCLGAALARLEGQIALRSLITRFPNLRLSTGKVEWQGSFAFRSLTQLHVELR